MTYNAITSNDPNSLVEAFFELYFSETVVPYKSLIIPTGLHTLTHTSKGMNKMLVDDKIYTSEKLIISGQSTKSYLLNVDEETKCCGLLLRPTTFYKLTQQNVSKLNNKHVPLQNISKSLFETFNTFFLENNSGGKALKNIETLIKKLPLTIDKDTENVDNAIAIINRRKGKISINDLLEHIPVSQKTLELQFNKIVGLTPKKYARLYRFSLIMKKYNASDLKLKDLVEMYNFHDASHFIKEFKYFMNESPKSYFKNESELIKKYLK
ncbi:helix-turn-helix domain-containing protein [Lacinutrix chionoecetis]